MAMNWRQTVVPDMFDNDIVPFWNGLKERKFLLYRCKHCNAHYFPMALCPKHEDNTFDDMEWAPTSGRGKIFAWELVHKVKTPQIEHELPYALVLVELDEGPIFATRLAGRSPPGLAIDQRVEIAYEDVPETGLTLPLFKIST